MAKSTAQKVRTESQKQFARIFDALTGRYNRWEVWQDFVALSAIAISNAVDHSNAPEREQTWQTITRKYQRREMESIAGLLGVVVDGMERNPDQDYLGELYMALELGNQQAGQFFTPYDVCRAMSGMTYQDALERVRAGDWVSVNDPACGAGATLLAFANECRRAGVNYQQSVLFTAQDIDLVTAQMCYIQLSLMGCAGYVVEDNTLSHPAMSIDGRALIPVHGRNVWYTPMYFHEVWHWRRVAWMAAGMFRRKP